MGHAQKCESSHNRPGYGWYSLTPVRGKYHKGGSANFISCDVGDRWMLAFDPDAGKLWFGLNGVWEGNPVAATGGFCGFGNRPVKEGGQDVSTDSWQSVEYGIAVLV